MTQARRRARLALTLAGLIVAAIGLIIYIPASIDSDTADQAQIDASAADWGDVLGYEASHAAKEQRFEADSDKRIAEEDKTFGAVLITLGIAIGASRWAVRPAATGQHAPQPVAAGPAPVADELAKLADLREQGILSDTEFEQQKNRLLGG
ncbi:SHOCT domain-containing protein [Streptomyces triticiradicis]|uniref:SHOCT domain-containing protein n=1 Tax=Streptomyces triticiradicis TaxID=2651189 RepID=UPI001CED3191|nr:SHOCT domain-containing protein [Streptomyces triticiradicis]